MSAAAGPVASGKIPAQRPPLLRRIFQWRRPSSTARSRSAADPAVKLATLLDDGERRDRLLIDLREQAFGPDHPDVATALHILAARYHLVRRYEQAETLYTRALGIRTERLGHDHPSTLEVLEDIGDLWRDRGERERAASAYDLALSAVSDPDRRRRKQLDYEARLVHIDFSAGAR